MKAMSEYSPVLYQEWGGGADGRNQVIAGCGNGSLRLFDLTLEVGLSCLILPGRADGS
jgi:hypothetical protein